MLFHWFVLRDGGYGFGGDFGVVSAGECGSDGGGHSFC